MEAGIWTLVKPLLAVMTCALLKYSSLSSDQVTDQTLVGLDTTCNETPEVIETGKLLPKQSGLRKQSGWIRGRSSAAAIAVAGAA